MTGQRYVTGKGITTPFEPAAGSNPPTAQTAAPTSTTADNRPLTPSLTSGEFLTQHPDLIGLPADQLDDALREILSTQPVSYHDVQDGITLLRGLLPQPLGIVDTHLALLLRGESIIGLVCVNQNDSLPDEQVPEHLRPNDLDTRYLMSRLLEAGATRLLLASTTNTQWQVLETEDRTFMDGLNQSLDLVNVELIAWLVMTDEQTTGWSSEQIQTNDSPKATVLVNGIATDMVDNKEPENHFSATVESDIKLPLCVWESSGRLSEVELVYWALEASKESCKKTLLDEDSDEEEIEGADYHFCKMQEIQNSLFGLVVGLASSLSNPKKEVSHE